MLVSAEEFSKLECYKGLQPGRLTISYHDTTHHPENHFESLLSIDLERSGLQSTEDAEPFFKLQQCVRADLPNSDAAVILDVLSLSLTRSGIISPPLSNGLYEEIAMLSAEDGLMLIADSNSLYNGSIHWLINSLEKPVIWLLPFVMSLTQIQQRDAGLKSLVNKRRSGNLSQALRSRAFINTSLGLLERNKGKYQVIELDPSLLRYLRPSGKGSSDPDQSDVLEDRLFVEGIHSVLQSTRTRATRRVVTSDVLLARILRAEGVPVLFIPVPRIGSEPHPCIRFDPLLSDFRGSSLAAMLWDLAHAFSCIRVTSGAGHNFTISAYWPNKAPDDWSSELLEVSEGTIIASSEVPVRKEAAVVDSELIGEAEVPPLTDSNSEGSSDNSAPSSAVDSDQKETTLSFADLGSVEAPAPADENAPAAVSDGDTSRHVFSRAELPQASLAQVLKLGSIVRQHRMPTEVSRVIAELGDDRPTGGIARRAFEILRRLELVAFDGRSVVPTEDLDYLNNLIEQNDLDAISAIFSRFKPYRVFLKALRNEGVVLRKDIEPLISSEIGRVGKEASLRLIKYHTSLGQAWTSDDLVRDGSYRPTDDEFTSSFLSVYSEAARDDLAAVVDVLPNICIRLRMSPWAAHRQIAKIMLSSGFPNLTFQPAAGMKPITSDSVLTGSLENFEFQPVPIDRIVIGERPVFTISGTVQ